MFRAPKILIVDDDPRMCDGLEFLLGSEGYEIHTRHNGRDALVAINQDQYDLVLLDYVLPDTEAAQIVDHISSHAPETLVIIMTGYPSLASAVNSLEKGAVDYLQKPFEYEELSKAVRHNLGLKALRSEGKWAQEALRESDEKYKTLVQNSLTGIFIHQDGKYVFVNDRFAQIHGSTPEELLGSEYLALIHPDERSILAQRAAARLKGEPVPQQYEVRRLRKDGTTVWCEMIATRIEYGGKPAIMGNIIDITERKRAEEALRHRSEELNIQAQNLKEVNTALKVLLKQREEDKTEIEENVVSNVKKLILPYVETLKRGRLDAEQMTYVSIIESNLKEILSPFLRKFSSQYLRLTPKEIQIADLIKLGKTTKEIAELLNLSTSAIKFHRENIRAKLGLKDQPINLRTHLLSFL